MNTLMHAYDRFRGSCQRICLSLTILEIVNPVAVVQLPEITQLVSLAREKDYQTEVFLRTPPVLRAQLRVAQVCLALHAKAEPRLIR